MDEAAMNSIKGILGYSDSQWDTWKKNPRNLKVANNIAEVLKYKIVAEVTSAYGCVAGHKPGDRIIYGGDGTLLCKKNPDRICCGLLGPLNNFVWTVCDKIWIGGDPTKIAFNNVHCVDVGLDNGGWGEVVVEVKVEKRSK